MTAQQRAPKRHPRCCSVSIT